MMELDELKNIWKAAKNTDLEYSKPALKDIFEVRTKRAVGRINTHMLLDAVMMIAATAGFITISFILGLKDRYMISGELVLLATFLGLHYRIKYQTINRFNFEEIGIGTALIAVVAKLKLYILLYKILIPTMATALFLLYHLNTYYYQYGSYSFGDNVMKIMSFASIIALTTLLLTKVITRVMYGRELKRLEKLADELKGY